MTLESSILNNLKKLPEAMQQAVLLYTEFLVNRITQQGTSQLETVPEIPSNKRGGLGIWKGKIWIADDFDAPLDDFQEYMWMYFSPSRYCARCAALRNLPL